MGRRCVEGQLNDYRLSDVVNHLKEKQDLKTADEVRCNLEFSERNLLVTFIKKDEGFESDSESAKSLGEEEKGGEGEKIIKDHVFRFPEPGRRINQNLLLIYFKINYLRKCDKHVCTRADKWEGGI